MRYEVLSVTPLMQNCSLVWCPQTRQGAVIDPGGESGRILQWAEKASVDIRKIWLTHGHIDHVGAAGALAAATGAEIEGPGKADEFLLNGLDQQSRLFGVPLEGSFTPARWLAAGECVSIGQLEFEVRLCPGHTPGHVVFYHRNAAVVFVGDVLFHGSIGRTDFPGGDHDALLTAIRDQLFPMGDAVTFVPGHGPEGTLGEERMSNPFLRGRI